MTSMNFTAKQVKLAQVFGVKPDSEEGKTRLTVRFDPNQLRLYRADLTYRKALPGATLLRFIEEPAQTPTGGRYTRRAITVRTRDGRLWYGTVKTGTDIVRLRLAPTELTGLQH
jgi:PAS domain-containing protein